MCRPLGYVTSDTTMTSVDDPEISFQQAETDNSEPLTDTTSFQFVPEKIVDFCIAQDGQRSYRVRWKDSWLTEELLALTYQHLINEFWESATSTDRDGVGPKEIEKTSKVSKIKIFSKHDDFDTQYRNIAPHPPQPTNIAVTSGGASIQLDGIHNVQAVNLKDITEDAAAVHMIEQGTILKAHAVIPKLQNNGNLASIVVNNGEVTITDGLQYQEISANVIAQPVLPKYQQALQQSIAVQQQQLEHNMETGKATFPKHVFSQARYVGKKGQEFTVNEAPPRVACEICQKSLKTKKMLWAHKVAVHFGGNFPCEICGKKCITAAELRRHKTSHSSERRFVCQYCGLAYKRWSHLYQHLRVHEEEKNFRCDVCHLNFKVQSELKDHCFAEHTTGEFVQCSVCKHKLQTPLAVYHHSMKHTGTRDFLCEICGSNFKRKQHLVTHMKTHLTEKKSADGSVEAYECQACDGTFNLKMELKAHCETAHPLHDNETVLCKTCQRKLNLSHSVYLHGLRHCGSREFKCTDCEQLFKRKAHLLRHKLDRHPDQPRQRKKRTVQSESIICSLCRKSFKYKTALIKHMANQHGILPKQEGSSDYGIVYRKNIKKPHQCDECFKRFKTVTSLRKHKFNKHADKALGVGVDIQYGSTDSVAQSEANEVSSLSLQINEDTRATMVPSTSIHPDDSIEMDSIEMDTTTCDMSDVTVNDNLTISTPPEQTASHVLAISNNAVNTVSSPNMPSEMLLSVESVEQENPVQHHGELRQQVITVDEETGQIFLLQTAINNEGGMHEKVVDDENMGKVIHIQSNTNNHRGDVDVGQVISIQGSGNPVTYTSNSATYTSNHVAYEGQVVGANASSIQSHQMTVEQLGSGQISIGQVINQDGISISSVPLESLQALAGEHNIIDFTQTSNEQIVVLLSALSGQSIQHI